MAAELLAGVEQSGLAVFVRTSVWAYPLVNTLHIIGVALLFGSIVPLDVRLLGARGDLPVSPLVRLLVPVSVTGLCLAAISGALLFIVRASDYAAEPLFLLKLGLIACGGANALLLRRTPAWRRAIASGPVVSRPRAHGTGKARLLVAALLSLVCWLGAIVLGRLTGYL